MRTRRHAEPATRNASLSVGVIGAGDIVRAVHLPVLQALDEAHVAWVTDVDADRARSVGRAYRVDSLPVPADLGDLPAADVYLLAIPYGVRDPYYEALRHRGAALYVEKPIATSVERLRELGEWFGPHALASGLMMRCWGPNLLVRDLVRSQVLGRLREVRFGFGQPRMVTSGRFYLDRRQGGAGMLAELGIHGLDTALFVSGARSVTVDRAEVVRDGDLEIHTRAELLLEDELGEQVPCEIVVTALENSIDGLEYVFEHAVVSHPLPGQGYALHGEQVDLLPVVRPRRAGAPYRILPFAGEVFPATKAQMFAEYHRLFLDGVRRREVNASAAAESTLTTTVIEALLTAGDEQRVGAR